MHGTGRQRVKAFVFLGISLVTQGRAYSDHIHVPDPRAISDLGSGNSQNLGRHFGVRALRACGVVVGPLGRGPDCVHYVNACVCVCVGGVGGR